jgi:predicted MFS family arabinose efflux permease
VDSALVEFIFIVGPALVAAFVATGMTVGAIALAAVCAAVGSILFLRAPAVRDWQVHPASGPGSLLGPLRHAPLRAVFAATVLYSLAFGLYEIAVTALAASRGEPAAAGLILALASVGSTAGALAYGAREWQMPVQRQFLLAVALMCAGLIVLAPISNLHLFAFATVIACAPMAPVIAAQSVLVSRLSPRDTLAESFTWGATCLLGGISGGIAVGGLLAQHLAAGWILLAAAVSSFLSGSVVWRALRDDQP